MGYGTLFFVRVQVCCKVTTAKADMQSTLKARRVLMALKPIDSVATVGDVVIS
jgi:hypothetical protein